MKELKLSFKDVSLAKIYIIKVSLEPKEVNGWALEDHMYFGRWDNIQEAEPHAEKIRTGKTKNTWVPKGAKVIDAWVVPAYIDRRGKVLIKTEVKGLYIGI